MSKLNDYQIEITRGKDGETRRVFDILANSDSAATSKPNWKCRKHSGWLYFPHKKDAKNYFVKKFGAKNVKVKD